MSVARTAVFDSALSVVKGAVVSALNVPTAKTTSSVKPTGPNGGKFVVTGVGTALTEDQRNLIVEKVDKKISENAKFRVFMLERAKAEKLYGETMYEKCVVPAEVHIKLNC